MWGRNRACIIRNIYEHAENEKTEKELVSVNLDYLIVSRGLKNSYMIMLMSRGLFIFFLENKTYLISNVMSIPIFK